MVRKRDRKMMAKATGRPSPSSGAIKVFFCEPMDVGYDQQSFECEACKHWTRGNGQERLTLEQWQALPFEHGKAVPCEKCGKPSKLIARGFHKLYRRTDTGEEVGGHEKLPPGAVWATDYGPLGPDGRSLHCMTPGGEWCIDSRANNCTMPDDNEHRCWVRTGRPEDGTLHVSKNGKTCAAGAGSIGQPGYHGFLHHGELRPA